MKKVFICMNTSALSHLHYRKIILNKFYAYSEKRGEVERENLTNMLLKSNSSLKLSQIMGKISTVLH